jgi:hypothetical protein
LLAEYSELLSVLKNLKLVIVEYETQIAGISNNEKDIAVLLINEQKHTLNDYESRMIEIKKTISDSNVDFISKVTRAMKSPDISAVDNAEISYKNLEREIKSATSKTSQYQSLVKSTRIGVEQIAEEIMDLIPYDASGIVYKKSKLTYELGKFFKDPVVIIFLFIMILLGAAYYMGYPKTYNRRRRLLQPQSRNFGQPQSRNFGQPQSRNFGQPQLFSQTERFY